MKIELQNISLAHNKTSEYYKDTLLDEFGLELDIEKARAYGNMIRNYISPNKLDNDGIASAIKKSREIRINTTLYYGKITTRMLESYPGSLFILNIWFTSPTVTLAIINGDGTYAQKAKRLSDFFRRDGNEYALATILGLEVPNSDNVVIDIERRTTDMLSQ